MKRISAILILLLLLTGSSYSETIRQQLDVKFNEMTTLDDDDLNIGSLFQDNRVVSEGKSKWKALGLSLVLPGAGQYYTDRKDKAAFFGTIETLVWSGFFGLRVYGVWKKEDYKALAALHAGADVNNKDDLFFEKLTYYDNLQEFNQFELLYEGSRAQPFPDTPDYFWNWDSDDNRDYYRQLRNDSKTAFRRSLLFLGGAVANRLLSGIDAYRSASSFNNRDEFNELGWKFYYLAAGPFDEEKIEIGISRRF